jgi:hypothetical protein
LLPPSGWQRRHRQAWRGEDDLRDRLDAAVAVAEGDDEPERRAVRVAADYKLDLAPEVAAKYEGQPVLLATSVINSTFADCQTE